MVMQWVDKPPPPKGGPWLAICVEGEWTFTEEMPEELQGKGLPHGGFHSKEAAQEYVKKLAVG